MSTNTDTIFWQTRRVCVTGGAGFLGQSLCTLLKARGCRRLTVPQRSEYDLTDPQAVRRLFDDARPDILFHLAAEVGGIGANRAQPGRFFYANLSMGMNLIEQARLAGVEKFVQIGTVCSYPKFCPTPFNEDDLWDGFPEETNAPYGIAKKALLVMLQAYRAQYGLNGIFIMPANLYGPGDDFDPQTSHVIPALIRKFCEAKQCSSSTVNCWGTGRPSREFLYVEDAAAAVLRAAEVYDAPDPINIGTSREITIRELASLIAELTGFDGGIEWDPSQPDGQPRRRLDITRAAHFLDWQPGVDLRTGLRRTIDWWSVNAPCNAPGLSPVSHIP
ncbi:MAG: GDP-L-fucose synthase [Planctomycetes bacterium]|nr:GDP-L-fucose synthase [Planctomycetota bacterium]